MYLNHVTLRHLSKSYSFDSSDNISFKRVQDMNRQGKEVHE